MGPQVVQQFEHGLEDHFGVGFAGFRVLGAGQPMPGTLAELFGADAGVGGGDNLQQAVHAALGQGLVVTFEHGLEGLLGLPLGVLRRQAAHFVEGKQHLEIQGLLAPQGAVIVEHRNSLWHRHIMRAAGFGHGLDEVHDGLPGRPLIPGRQWRGGLSNQRRQQQKT
ncbi:hypothetical protein D3C80_1416390 [compost metagenome]